MIDVRKLCQEAIAGVPASLKDDPTTWSDEPTRDDVRDALSQATYDNVASALAGAFGRESERIATLMDAAIAEDGPLADLDAIWDAEVANGRTRPNLSLVYDATDWDTRVNILRDAIRVAVVVTAKSAQDAITHEETIDFIIGTDPRLAHLVQPPSPIPDNYRPPAFLGLLPPEEFDPAAGDEIVWDDEPTVTMPQHMAVEERAPIQVSESTAATANVWDDEPAPPGRRGRGKRAGAAVPLLSGLLEAAGFADKDVARLLGIDKSTYSLARAGKRPWQGLRDEQAIALRAEIRARADALAEALVALDTPGVRNPDTPS